MGLFTIFSRIYKPEYFLPLPSSPESLLIFKPTRLACPGSSLHQVIPASCPTCAVSPSLVPVRPASNLQCSIKFSLNSSSSFHHNHPVRNGYYPHFTSVKTEAQVQPASQKEVDLHIISPTRKKLLEGPIFASLVCPTEDSAVLGNARA